MLSRSGRLSVWEAPNILRSVLSCSGLYEDGLYAGLRPRCPMLLTPGAGGGGLEAGSRRERLLAVEARPPSARRWTLQSVALRPGAGNQDTEAFASSSLTTRETRTTSTPARPDALQRFLPEMDKPKLAVAYAFDILPPQTKESSTRSETGDRFLAGRIPAAATVSRAAFDSAKHEVEPPRSGRGRGSEAGATRDRGVIPSCGKREKRWFAFLASHAPRRREDRLCLSTFRSVLRFKNSHSECRADRWLALLTRRSLIR